MNEKIQDYIYSKILIYLLLVGDSEIDNSYLKISFLESLKEVVSLFVEKNYITEEIKYNINNVLIKARELRDSDYSKRIDIINDIVIMLNGAKIDDNYSVNRCELYKRTLSKRYLNISACPNDEIKYKNKYLSASVCMDLLVLSTHITTVDEFMNNGSEFKDSFTEEMDPDLYFSTLNTIIFEFPEMFKNEQFYSRMNYILNYIVQNYNNYNRVVKKFIKKIDKNYR